MKAKILAGVRTIVFCGVLFGSCVLPMLYENTAVSRIGFFVLEWIAIIVTYIMLHILVGFIKGVYNTFLHEEEEK